MAAIATAHADGATRPNLTGMVSFKDNTPVKDAAVFIYSAGPKEGRGTL